VTEQNQQRYHTVMFSGAKPYLIVHIVLGIALMLVVIDPKSSWSTTERWIGSFLLWHMIINWSGIMESKSWLLISEVLRLVGSCAILIYFSGQEVWSPLNLVWIGISMLSIIWSCLFFRVYLPLRVNQQP
jgi:alkylglycerol monooxygenase